MEEIKRKKLLKYVIASAIGAVTAFGIAYLRGVLSAESVEKVMSCISDGLFVVGMLYTGFGLMMLIISEGVLDIISYGFKSVLFLFTPYRRNREEGGYYEYKMRKKEERKAVPFHILWIGIAFILIAAFFLVLYYNV